MEKILILIRHAQAISKETGKNDLERVVSETGVIEAVKMGKYLSAREICMEKILTSHANRSKETANLIVEQLKLDKERIEVIEDLYEASARILLNTVNGLDDKLSCVALIGHNPSLTFFCEYISSTPVGYLPPGGLIIMKFTDTEWSEIEKGSGVLSETIFPEHINSN